MNVLTLAGGCFWCTEAIFQKLNGVTKVVSGYTGGTLANPTYDEVCTGKTGHAESIQITYDPKVIAFEQLLDVFFHLHDPTTLNKQGVDSGTEYRSAIFYSSNKEKELSKKKISEINKLNLYGGRQIVTTLEEFKTFYPADPSHQDFYNKNSYPAYCSIVIDPKIKKLYKEFGSMVKAES